MSTSKAGKIDRQHATTLTFASTFMIVQNLIGVVASVPVLVTGILLARAHEVQGEECAKFMQTPIIAIGALLLAVSLAGFVAAIFSRQSPGHPWIAGLHLILMFCLVILLFCFAILALEITNKGTGH
eukprot:c27457_g1_i1 orf=1-378(-)